MLFSRPKTGPTAPQKHGRQGELWGQCARTRGLCGALAALLVACSSPRATAEAPVEELPLYSEEQSDLFDDSIAPEVFGLRVDRPDPRQDKTLRQRVSKADHIARVKLRTIREERFADAVRYKIVLQPVGTPLLGAPLPNEVELLVGRASPSLSMLRSMTVEVIGKQFIVLIKRFQLNGEQVLHFRAEPDEENMVAAMRSAIHSQ